MRVCSVAGVWVLAFLAGLASADYAASTFGNYSYTVTGSSLLVMLTGAGMRETTCLPSPPQLSSFSQFSRLLSWAAAHILSRKLHFQVFFIFCAIYLVFLPVLARG